VSLSQWHHHESEGGGCGIIIDLCLSQF
jgi:hypothetical protein